MPHTFTINMQISSLGFLWCHYNIVRYSGIASSYAMCLLGVPVERKVFLLYIRKMRTYLQFNTVSFKYLPFMDSELKMSDDVLSFLETITWFIKERLT